jgi:hypothetical protein
VGNKKLIRNYGILAHTMEKDENLGKAATSEE